MEFCFILISLIKPVQWLSPPLSIPGTKDDGSAYVTLTTYYKVSVVRDLL